MEQAFIRRVALISVWFMSAISTPAQASPDARILAADEDCSKDARPLLERLVAIDSGSGDAEGLAKIGAIYADRLRLLRAEVRSVAPAQTAVGDNIVATFRGTGRGRIAELAHDRFSSLKIICTTGFEKELNEGRRSLPAGSVVLAKPFDVERLAACVRAIQLKD